MNLETSTYLRLFDDVGAWIARPDFMVLSAMSEPDPMSVEHTYSSMLLEDKINPAATDMQMSAFATRLKQAVFEKYVKERFLTGAVVLELARLASATQKPPTVNAARRLVAYKHHHCFGTGTLDTTKREVEKSFKQFRNTAHLQAAAVLDPSLMLALEGNETACRKFLGIARAFEEFIDENVVSKAFEWSPLRVPTQIDRLSIIEFLPLSDQELEASKMT